MLEACRPQNTFTLTLSFAMATLLLLGHGRVASALDVTVSGAAFAETRGGTWITVEALIEGDDNLNGHTLFEYSTSIDGPWDPGPGVWRRVPGKAPWRRDVSRAGFLLPETDYFVRVTHIDPDGVLGLNPQVLGPITTPIAGSDAVTMGPAIIDILEDEILVEVPISSDENQNHQIAVEIGSTSAGPWIRRCGATGGFAHPFHPFLCRLRSLTPGATYWIQIRVTDPDGVVSDTSQVLGPFVFEGMENLALGAAVSADEGWGCCSQTGELVDGRIQDDTWSHGYAWSGGTGGWAGGPAGWKQASLDLGDAMPLDRVVVWYHNPGSVPLDWAIDASHDNQDWREVFSSTEPTCRTEESPLPGDWALPACAHRAEFTPVFARYVRYRFDDRSLFSGIHGWAQEIEVFSTVPAVDFEVTSSADDGPGSLRQALLDANDNGLDRPVVVGFGIPTTDPGFDGSVFTIRPTSELPVLRDRVILEGRTQALATGDTNPVGPEIVLNGALVDGPGLRLDDDNVVRHLVIQGFGGDAISLSWSAAADHQADRNRILDNYLGTDPTGTVAVSNWGGISINGFGSPGLQARDNIVEGNVISGNMFRGVTLCDAAGTVVTDNRIGVGASGAALGNGGPGTRLICAGAPRNRIMGNIIAYNSGDGVYNLPDYRFPVSTTPDGHWANTFRANKIFENGGLAIDLVPPPFPPTDPPSTASLNDHCDADDGGNGMQNYPLLQNAFVDGSQTQIEGILDSYPEASFEIDFYVEEPSRPLRLLGSASVPTSRDCTTPFAVSLEAVASGAFVYATATDAEGNTSEMSPSVTICLLQVSDGNERTCSLFSDGFESGSTDSWSSSTDDDPVRAPSGLGAANTGVGHGETPPIEPGLRRLEIETDLIVDRQLSVQAPAEREQ